MNSSVRKFHIIFTTLLISLSAFSTEVKVLPLDFSATNLDLKSGQIAYGWQLMSWEDWLRRPTSGPLLINTGFSKSNIEIFEAHAAAVVQRPSSDFTETYLHNLNTIRKVSPQNQHSQVSGRQFTVETQINFPSEWAKIISMGKTTKLLDEKTTDHIKMTSVFIFLSKEDIKNSPELQKKTKLLGGTNSATIEALDLQGSTKINQIANFISVATVFYQVDNLRTVIDSHTVVAIKKNVLNLGINSIGIKLDGRSVLLGKSSIFNSDKGIGAGLPQYYLELFDSMIRGFEN